MLVKIFLKQLLPVQMLDTSDILDTKSFGRIPIRKMICQLKIEAEMSFEVGSSHLQFPSSGNFIILTNMLVQKKLKVFEWDC